MRKNRKSKDTNTEVNLSNLDLDMALEQSRSKGPVRDSLGASEYEWPQNDLPLDGRGKKLKNLDKLWFEQGLSKTDPDKLLDERVDIVVNVNLRTIMMLKEQYEDIGVGIDHSVEHYIEPSQWWDKKYLMALYAIVNDSVN